MQGQCCLNEAVYWYKLLDTKYFPSWGVMRKNALSELEDCEIV